MTARLTTSSLQRVRRMLLFGLLVFVGTLIVLYWLGRRPPTVVPPIDAERAPDGTVVRIIGKGFRYEVSEEGEKLFDIEADRLLSDESDLFVLEGVKLTTQRDDGKEYTMTAKSGSYRLQRNEATLKGNVVLTGSGGLRLETEGLELRRHGNVVVSSAPVRIELGETYRGRANRLEVVFPRNRILLAGNVELTTAEGAYPRASLSARRTVFFRDTHSFLAEGSVEMHREEDVLRARRLSLNFDDLDRRVLFARASWDVVATLNQFDTEGVPSVAKVAGDELSVVFNEASGDPERLEIDAPQGGLAHLEVADASGLERVMRADYLWAEFQGGRVRRAEGTGGVVVREGLSFSPNTLIRQICSDSAVAEYDATGGLDTLELRDAVSYLEADLQAGGDTLTAEGGGATLDLVGDMAWVASPDGRLEAPRIHMDREEGRARALDGVRAVLVSEGSPDLASGEDADLPVRVEARTAEWTADPRHFEFQGSVRAWQGENFLVSQTLGFEDGVLRAEGGVRSVWHERTAGDTGGERPPVTIASLKMRYLEGQGRLVYEGDAQVAQGGRTMRCPLMQLEMNEHQEFERMYCEGGTFIGDSEQGSQINGDAAIYNTTAGKVKVMGDPVRLNQKSGGTVSARLMVYDFATAISEIDSVKDAEADLFMTSSEYFRQFAPLAAAGTVPGAPLPPAGGVSPPPLPGTPPPGTPLLGTPLLGTPPPGTGNADGASTDDAAAEADDGPPAEDGA
jgi:LPS export ABC transporter protein LptC